MCGIDNRLLGEILFEVVVLNNGNLRMRAFPCVRLRIPLSNSGALLIQSSALHNPISDSTILWQKTNCSSIFCFFCFRPKQIRLPFHTLVANRIFLFLFDFNLLILNIFWICLLDHPRSRWQLNYKFHVLFINL